MILMEKREEKGKKNAGISPSISADECLLHKE
jgi:hypothetical protein